MLKKQIIFPLLILLSVVSQESLQAALLSNVNIVPGDARRSAPDFEIENLGGGNSSLADYRGKLVLLNFWATWCIPCREEMPGMETLWKNYKGRGLVIVAISVDEGSRARIKKFSEIFGLSFPVLLDPESKVSDRYKVSSMPTSFLIDRNGKIIGRIVGSEDWLSDEAVQLVETLLAQ